MHMVSSEKKCLFNGGMCQVFGCFSSRPFLKQLAAHVSTDIFQLNSRVWRFFSSIKGTETFFLEGFKVFCAVLIKDKSPQAINPFKVFSFSFIVQVLQILLLF